MRSVRQLAILACAILGASAAYGQVLRPAGTFPQAYARKQPPAAAGGQSAVTPPPPPAAKTPFSTPAPVSATTAPAGSPAGVPSSLLDQPAQPAQVKLSDGKLLVEAHNSSLSAILHQISSTTGMKVEGFTTDQRVFGSYGPDAPREVLLSLLDGSGYNVMMVGGTASEAPLRLELSSPGQTSVTPAANTATQASQGSDDSDDSDDTTPSQPTRSVVFPAEQSAPPEGQPPPAAPNGVRTPQELLQQLQQLHQREEQQQQAPQ